MAAGELIRRLVQAGDAPTVADRQVLAAWPGWGATPELFDEKSTKYEAERDALKALWSDAEWDAARRTVINAHYTDPALVAGIWAAVTAAGFDGGTVLEPGCGSGNFISAAPAGAVVTGVELDPTTAAIAAALHPDATVLAESFADTVPTGELRAGFDVAIGNVPFSDATLYDPAYNRGRHSMHNHFIIKSLRMVKPGGIVAVLSSRYTMDAGSEKARLEMAEHGDFLGAVRLPAGAHRATAGTEVITDLLIFRRHRPGETGQSNPGWLQSPLADVDGSKVRQNAYFAAHPENVIGSTTSRLGRFGPELTVVDNRPDTAADFQAAAVAIAAGAVAVGRGIATEGQALDYLPCGRASQDPASTVGHLSIADDGTIQRVGLTGVEALKVPKNAVAEVASLIGLRDAVTDVLEQEATGADDTPALEVARKHLNAVYDEHVNRFGFLNRVELRPTGRFEENGEEIIRRIYPRAQTLFRHDPRVASVLALETYNEDAGTGIKAAIFDRRVVGVPRELTRVDSIDDALMVSLDRGGNVDLDLIAELTDQSSIEARSALGQLVFEDPGQGDLLVSAREYLSGNVRAKLKAAIVAAEKDERLAVNVEALTAVQPAELGPAEIVVKPGALWVPKEIMSAWVAEISGREVYAIEAVSDRWKYKIKGGKFTEKQDARWAVVGDQVRKAGTEVLTGVLNMEYPVVKYTVKDADGEKTYVDSVASEGLAVKQEELREHFQDWLWKDAKRADTMQTLYNDLFNGIKLRDYDCIELTLPGKALSFTPKPHQYAAVARMVAEESVGLFHEVGAGKTAEMVMGVMELKRLGMVTKPAVIVPNHMLDQFTREFKQIYPRANVLAAGSDEVNKAHRALFVAKAATGDWDAVIMTQSSFSRIGLGAAEADFLQLEVDRLVAEKTELANSELSSKRSVKSLESDILKIQERIKEAGDTLNRDTGLSFEETGIDYLCVDEAHAYKNRLATSSVNDLRNSGSKMSLDLAMKLWYLRDNRGQSRVATLATATPVANNMVEMFTMQNYLAPRLLQAAGVHTADRWAKQFTEQATEVETSVSGAFQTKERTRKFVNLPELLALWHTVGDVKTSEDLNLPVPLIKERSDGKRDAEVVVARATDAQTELIGTLTDRAYAIKNRLVDPRDDNMLNLTGDARTFALDARLYDPVLVPEDGEETKIGKIAATVMREWEASKNIEYTDWTGNVSDTPGSLQLVFADRGTPSEQWNAYDGLRDELVRRGMPREQVRFIHEAKDDVAKGRLFEDARNGRVSVLIGSTQKMGTGTNIQTRLSALHHLDCPWRPADVVQRDGRGIRQGNQNSEIAMYRYVTKGSFDSYMWQTVSRKAKFIGQVMTGKLDIREVDNISDEALSFAEVSAISAGDMRILEKAGLDADIQKLTRLQRSHSREISANLARKHELSREANRLQERADLVSEKVLPSWSSTAGDAFTAEFLPDEYTRLASARTYTTREDAARALQHLIVPEVTKVIHSRDWQWQQRSFMSEPRRLGSGLISVGGVPFTYSVTPEKDRPSSPMVHFRMKHAVDHVEFATNYDDLIADTAAVWRRFESRTNALPARVADWERQADQLQSSVAELDALLAAPWSKADELQAKSARRDELVAEMEAESSSSGLVASGPHEQQPEKSTAYFQSPYPVPAAGYGALRPSSPTF